MYYKQREEKDINQEAMKVMDKYGLDHPHAGILSMQDHLRQEGITIGVHRIRRLMRLMNYRSIYPVKSLSKKGDVKYVYPYLLRNLKVIKPNQVWATDISYIPMKSGHLYITAIIDVYSRRILAWDISNSLEAIVSLSVLKEAIKRYGVPEILNSDQGSQYTSKEWTSTLESHGIRISMDGKGRCLDNIYIERFWRTLKREHIYLNPADDGQELRQGVRQYMAFYNSKRCHQGIARQTPDSMYFGYKEAA
jgi:putative transposase